MSQDSQPYSLQELEALGLVTLTTEENKTIAAELRSEAIEHEKAGRLFTAHELRQAAAEYEAQS